jgi:hypothetical protein
MKTISNTEDIIDSRDVIERLTELRDELQPLVDAIGEATKPRARSKAIEALEGWLGLNKGTMDSAAAESFSVSVESLEEWQGDAADAEELLALLKLETEASGCSDWEYGATLIRRSYFRDYAEQLAEDIGDYDSREARWPYTCIDWDKAASELEQDYSEVDFDGEAYLIRD